MQRPKLQVALLVSLLLCGCKAYRPDTKAIERQVASAVPLGSSSPEVIAYLNGSKIDHSPYTHDPTNGNMIDSVMDMSTSHGIAQPSYNVLFRFSDQGRLTGYDVQYLGYLRF
jgi:hypothetical protein